MPEIFGEDTEQHDVVDNQTTEAIINIADPLKIDLDDKTFVDVMDDLIEKSRKHFSKQLLSERRQRNEDYYLGRQIENLEKQGELKKYSARYLDNVIYEAEGTLKAVAVSRVPDLLVKPGKNNTENEKAAEDLTEVLNNRMRKREIRNVLGRAYSHRPIYFTGVIKAVWDSEIGPDGDYRYEAIHPYDIDVDHTASSNDTDGMNWVAHHYPLTVKEILMRFPDKEAELKQELKWGEDNKSEEKKLASTIKITEIWFTWYKKEGDKWERVEGVAWKYRSVVFDKQKNPYWDWEGEKQLFKYDVELGKVPVEEADLRGSIMMGQPIPGLKQETIYYNHFRDPRKPFYFLGHNQLGMGPYEETTRIEQSILLQDNVNVRGKQITELSATAMGKLVFSTMSGLNAGDVAQIDMSNKDQDILIDGNLRDVYSYIPGQQPTVALFQDQEINRERLFSKMGTNAALRGVRGGEDTATQTQLYKESDFTRIDDEVEDTINAAAEWMADWAMQFIKLFYTERHMERIAGQSGITTFQLYDRDIVQDGMEVEVNASSVDKLRRKREAFELAGIGMIDPVNFFKDIEASDPEGRAEALMTFQAAPDLYMQKYVKGMDTQGMVDELGNQPVETPMSPEAQAVAPPVEGVPPMGV